MQTNKIIGNSLKAYRKKLELTQENVASVILVDRSAISLYENGEREISLVHLEKLADLFGIELEDLLEENPENAKINLSFAFRAEGFDEKDLISIAEFQKVVKYYLKMKRISNES